jgi:hypothetical protein
MALAFHCAHRLLDDTSARARAETAFRGLVASARVERDFARALHYHTRAERQA